MTASPPMLLAAGAAAGLLIALAATLLVMRVASSAGFVDRPGGHKSHAAPIPYGGGAALLIAFALPLAGAMLALHMISDEWLIEHTGQAVRDLAAGARERIALPAVILGGAVAIFAVGLFDDLRPLGPWTKLACGLLIAGGVAWLGDLRIATFTGPALSLVLTVLWIVIITNTLNFLDNMDGLSAGVAAIAAAFFVVCGLLAGQWLVPALGSVFFGALLGFLVFNFPPARIFMGDAGSLLIGYLLAVLSILTSYWDSGADPRPFALAAPLCILAVPIYDFISVVVIRLLEGRSPMRGDQRHFSHRLVQRGLSKTQAVLTIYLATATTCLAATLLPVADLRITMTVLAIVMFVLLIVAILEAPLRNEELRPAERASVRIDRRKRP